MKTCTEKSLKFDGLDVWPEGKERFIEELLDRIQNHLQTLACYLNAHTYNLSCTDSDYRQILSQADILYPDGMSIVWAERLLSGAKVERMTGVDFFEEFLGGAQKLGVRFYFLGGRPGAAARAVGRLKERFPELNVVGVHDGDLGKNGIHAEKVITDINDSRPDVLLIGLGSPLQERFARDYRTRLSVPVIWTVGALLDYWAGLERRCPRWMGRMGLEWLWRLGCDPKNKWRRYLLGNWKFAYRIFRLFLKEGIRGSNGNGSNHGKDGGSEVGMEQPPRSASHRI